MKFNYATLTKTSIVYVSILLALAVLLNLTELNIFPNSDLLREIFLIILLIWFIVGVYLFTNWIRETYLRYKKLRNQ